MSKYWDIGNTVSYNRLFNFILGIRGAGKTYGLLKWCTEKYLEKGYRYMYVRRSDEELKKLTTQKSGRLFNAVQTEFDGHLLWAESNVLHIDKEICGYAQAVSTARKLKSDALDNVRYIIFDEYKIDKGYQTYLPDEVTAFLELYESIARPGTKDYDVTCFFLGNAISQSDPYMDTFGLQIPYKKDIWTRDDFLVQMVAPPELVEAKKKTRFYKAIEGTAYAAYAAENKFLRDNPNFIMKKSRESEYQFTLSYYDSMIGVWKDYKNGCYVISDDVDKQCRTIYAATTEDHQPNTLLLKGFKSSNNLKSLKQAYDLGCVRYENMRLNNQFRDIVRMGL